MSLQLLKCAKCGSSAEITPGERSPSSCPQCGSPLSSTDGEGTVTETMAYDPNPYEIDERGELTVPGFLVREKVGRGGMGIVYRAKQISLQREVALKVLPPALASDPDTLARFHQEATVAASLINSHILPLFDIIESGGTTVLVMPYIAGRNLGELITQHREARAPLTGAAQATCDRAYFARILPLLDQLLEAVAVIHEAGILHRDIKPSNMLVDSHGHLWLADFGLAQLRHDAGNPGKAFGTPGYMSPEQAEAEPADERSDIFSVGATIYKTLTGELPFGKKAPPPGAPATAPSRKHQGLSPDLDAVIAKALEADRTRRYQSAAEMRDDWQRARTGLLPHARRTTFVRRWGRTLSRHRWMAGTLLLAVMVLGLAGLFAFWQPSTQELRTVRITTDPPGAQLALVPIDEYGEFKTKEIIRPKQRTPAVIARVPVGNYLVVANVPDHGFHEVYRVVPAKTQGGGQFRHDSWTKAADGTIELTTILIPNRRDVEKQMILVDGGDFEMGADRRGDVSFKNSTLSSPAHPCRVESFFVDPTEINVRQYETVRQYTATEWRVPSAMRTAYGEHFPRFQDLPVTHITFSKAQEIAEFFGKRLPTEAEFEFCATNRGTSDYPWGKDAAKVQEIFWAQGEAWPVGKSDFDVTELGVKGLYSNVAEWTASMQVPYSPLRHPSKLRLMKGGDEYFREFLELRVVRGGPSKLASANLDNLWPNESLLGPRHRFGADKNAAYPWLGFRGVRSVRPRFLEETIGHAQP